MAPIFKYTGDQTVVYTALKNRNGTTVKAEPGKLFDFQSTPTSKDANGVDVAIPEFVQLTDEQVAQERAGEDTTSAAPAGGTTPPPSTTPETILSEAEAAVAQLVADAKTAAETAGTDVEAAIKGAEAEGEKLFDAAKAKIEELFGHTPPAS
jgi:hypothetical protein